MSEKILQCCYTNLTEEKNGIVSSGWVPVAVSDNLPTDAKDGCLKKQTVLSAINKEMKDEQGEILNLLEVSGDGSYIYVMRTQYGLKDRTGTRDNMFSHAYVFPCKGEDIVTDPNVFLTLTRDNFVADLESAEARKAKEALDRPPAMTLNSAVERSGMTGEGYLQLIRCVYAQYVERRNPKPL